jgi:predicted ribosomally synthesized peptide with SipW-like signal peptide
MKNITRSMVMIVAVAALAIGGTVAYFSDTEVSTGNTISAGTIDISVDNENPWQSTNEYTFSNLEPSDDKNINVTLKNEGTNPAVIWKKVSVTAEADNIQSEPECVAENGTWNQAATVGSKCTGQTLKKDDLSTQFVYSMKIGGNVNINKAWDVKVSDVNNLWIPIGKLDANTSITVDQNYYFDEMAGNEYQGDSMTFDVTFYAEQLDAPGPAHSTRGVILDNKNASSGNWEPLVGDGIWGILTWDGSGNYKIKAWGLAAGTYQLDYFVEPSTDNFFGSSFTVGAGGSVDSSGTRPALATDASAKYWLRDLSWNNDNTLWEANLVH